MDWGIIKTYIANGTVVILGILILSAFLPYNPFWFTGLKLTALFLWS